MSTLHTAAPAGVSEGDARNAALFLLGHARDAEDGRNLLAFASHQVQQARPVMTGSTVAAVLFAVTDAVVFAAASSVAGRLRRYLARLLPGSGGDAR